MAKKITPIHLVVKYLGVLLDEHMSWNEQIYQMKLKLNCAIVILSKLQSHELKNFKICILFALSISSVIRHTTMGPEKSRNKKNKGLSTNNFCHV